MDVGDNHDTGFDGARPGGDFGERHRLVIGWWRGFQLTRAGRFLLVYTPVVRSAAEDPSHAYLAFAAPVLAVLGVPLLLLFLAGGGAGRTVALLVAILVALPVLVAVWLFWFVWSRDFEQPLRDALNTREGFMRPRELADTLSGAQVLRDARFNMPATFRALGASMRPWMAGVLIGESKGTSVYAPAHLPGYGVSPARMGKTTNFVMPLVCAAPGPVVTTSTRKDVIDHTLRWRIHDWVSPDGQRHEAGRVFVFDPMGMADTEAYEGVRMLMWSPVDGCEDPHVARTRGHTLAASLDMGSDNKFWEATSGTLMQALLHAAALKPGGSMLDVYRWSRNFQAAQEAATILEDAMADPGRASMVASGSIAPDWSDELRQLRSDDSRIRNNKWIGVSQALNALSEPKVRQRLSIAHDDPRRFRIDGFLASQHDTIYFLCKARDKGSPAGVGGFVSMFLDALVAQARQAASMAPDGKLEPPVALVLDEIANIDRWVNLPQAVTAGSGDGIWTWVFFQSRTQARDLYGTDTEATLWDSCQKWVLGGISNMDDLNKISGLLGERRLDRRDHSYRGGLAVDAGSVQEHTDFKPVARPDEIHRLPDAMAICLTGRYKPAIVNLIPPWRRDWQIDHHTIQAGDTNQADGTVGGRAV